MARPDARSAEARLRRHVENLADQICRAVDGSFDFLVGVDVRDETVEKLQMLINFLLDAAHRAVSALESQNRRLSDHDAWMNAIVDGVPAGIIASDDRGVIRMFNAHAERIFGYSADEVIGENVRLLMVAPDRERHDGYIRDHKERGASRVMGASREVVGRHRNGSELELELSLNKLCLRDRVVFIAMLRDVGEEKRAREALIAARDEAQVADRAKSAFLANMSHEIRTPMTAILGFADELVEGGDLTQIPPERLAAVNAIRRNGQHLLQIINDVLDLSKIVAGKLSIERLSFSPLQVVTDVCSSMRIHAHSKGIELLAEFPGSIPETVRTDPTRLRQILMNLVGNAVKFTSRGTIRLTTRLVQSDKGAALQFDVVDTGIGMTPGEVARLFEPFTQADDSTTRKYGGTGLGLSISRRLAEMMDGSIEVSSQPDRGSRFRLTLPIGSLHGAPMVKRPAEALAAGEWTRGEEAPAAPTRSLDCRILLAEDGVDNQRLIRGILERAGAEVEVADDGRAALERALKARERGEPFDVILMDMQMPVLDGYDATRALRRADYELPILALTAHAMAGDRDRCLGAGCDEHLSKPIDRRRLIETIARHLPG